MTTRTDYQSITKLMEQYSPAERGLISIAEAKHVREILEIESRTDIELQNIRDMLVMVYGMDADRADDAEDAIRIMDAMSGACAVIDGEKRVRGLAV